MKVAGSSANPEVNFASELKRTRSRIVTVPGDADTVRGRTMTAAITNTNPTLERRMRALLPLPARRDSEPAPAAHLRTLAALSRSAELRHSRPTGHRSPAVRRGKSWRH